MQKYRFPGLDDDGREIDVEAPDHLPEAVADTVEPPGSETPSSVEELLPLWQDDGGSFRLSGRLDADAGMVVEAALDEARDRLFQRCEFGVGLAEALVEMAQVSLGSVADPARRYVTWDGTVTSVFLENGLPVSVGRAGTSCQPAPAPSLSTVIMACVGFLVVMRRSALKCTTWSIGSMVAKPTPRTSGWCVSNLIGCVTGVGSTSPVTLTSPMASNLAINTAAMSASPRSPFAGDFTPQSIGEPIDAELQREGEGDCQS